MVEATTPSAASTSSEKAKKVRKARIERPFVIQSPDAKSGKAFVDLEVGQKFKSTLEALNYIQRSEKVPPGRYRVIQVCADKMKTVQTVSEAKLV